MTSAHNDLAARLIEAAAMELRMHVPFGVQKCATYCESPIEILFLAALTLGVAIDSWANERIRDFPLHVLRDESKPPPAGMIVIPQYKWKDYRIDFAVCHDDYAPRFFVECDGHQFHERTPEQAQRDRSRDRAIQQAGIPIIRFTGREIYRDPFKCAGEVIDFLAATLST